MDQTVRTLGPAALELRAFSFTYGDATQPALTAVSASVSTPQIVAVLGPQGCGKTTLLRAIAGTLAGIYNGIATGTIHLRIGDAPVGEPPWSEHVSSFFDGEVQVTLAAETVREEIALPHIARRTPEGTALELAAVAAEELGIAGLLDRRVTELSGGEEKLVGLAATLGCPSAIYVVDEPFEQLDDRHVVAVIRALNRRARRGSLVLVATNALDIALNIAESLLLCSEQAWSLHRPPSYGLVRARGLELGVSPVLATLGAATPEILDRIRTYRDAARCLATLATPS